MAGSVGKRGWGTMLRYMFGGALLLLAGVSVLIGTPWFLCLIVAAASVVILLGGNRRIFRPAVSRTATQIVCRYLPWYEGNVYILNVVVPLLGIAAFAAGYAPGNPAWLRFVGVILLLPAPLFIYSGVRMWRRCFLRFTPSSLTVRTAERGSEPTDIRRELVQSIESKLVPNPVSGPGSLQVEITYRPVESNGTTKTVILGPQLTIQPINLLDALVAWNNGAHSDPGQLLERVEQILRGCSTSNA